MCKLFHFAKYLVQNDDLKNIRKELKYHIEQIATASIEKAFYFD